jgi:hypothetical protein
MKNKKLRFLPVQVIILLGFCLPACALGTPSEKKLGPVFVSSVTIAGGDLELAVGQKQQLNVTVKPDNADNRGLIFRSSMPDIAEVNGTGFVTAKGPGEAGVTATAADGSEVSATVQVTVTVTGPGPVPGAQAVAQIFNALKGKAVITNGWADRHNGGSGVRYTGPANYTLIDDATYPSASGKLAAFKDALGSASPSFIIVSGDIDLSDGKISDDDHSYYEQFDSTTHKRIHGDITADIASDTTIIGIDNARI